MTLAIADFAMAQNHKSEFEHARKCDSIAQLSGTFRMTRASFVAACVGTAGSQAPGRLSEPDRSIWLRADPDLTDDLVSGMQFSSQQAALIPMHEHSKGQLMHVLRGVLVISIQATTFTLPPGRAIWLPPGVPHSARYPQSSEMRTIFVDTGVQSWTAPEAVQVYRLDELSSALLTEAATFDCGSRLNRTERITLELLFSRMRALDDVGLVLPEGQDPRLRRATAWLMANPAAEDDLDHLAGIAFCSRRTLYRLFEHETGMTPGLWRRQMRMGQGLEMLASGSPIKHVAQALGFSAPGNFTAVFKATFGTVPSAFFG